MLPVEMAIYSNVITRRRPATNQWHYQDLGLFFYENIFAEQAVGPVEFLRSTLLACCSHRFQSRGL